MKRVAALRCLAIFALGLLGAAGTVTPALADSTEAGKIRELQKRLDQRDALIRSLMRRVDRLEHDEAARSAAKTNPPARQSSDTAKASSPVKSEAQRPKTAPETAQQSGPRAGRQAQQEAPPGQQSAAPESGPGQFTVSPEAAQRALERALVQSGALLLPAWTAEFVPSLTYQRNQVSTPNQLALTTTGSVFVTQSVQRFTQLEAAGLLRLGLPWDSQAELRFPYDYKSNSTTNAVGGTGITEHITDAHGTGDPSLSLTKQLMIEKEWLPSLFVSGLAQPNFSMNDKGIPLGTGFDEFKLSMVATKRQDPLVFTGGFTYQTALENKGVLPGDQYTPSIGLLFAVSPETSLQFSQQLTFVRPLQRNHLTVPGSDQVQGIFNAGVLSILGRGFVANLTAGIGETADAPALTLAVSFPIRLN